MKPGRVRDTIMLGYRVCINDAWIVQQGGEEYMPGTEAAFATFEEAEKYAVAQLRRSMRALRDASKPKEES